MKKIRLNVADLGATEILTREQLKSVFGGSGSGSGSGSSNSCSGLTKDSCNYQPCVDTNGDIGKCSFVYYGTGYVVTGSDCICIPGPPLF